MSEVKRRTKASKSKVAASEEEPSKIVEDKALSGDKKPKKDKKGKRSEDAVNPSE